jgi:excisionase family DNA binding protein
MTVRDVHALLAQFPAPSQLPVQEIPVVMARLATLQNELMSYWLLNHASNNTSGVDRDVLLSVNEAAERLKVSTDYLYRNARKLPFTVREGRLLRFSANGMDEYIRRKRNRN